MPTILLLIACAACALPSFAQEPGIAGLAGEYAGVASDLRSLCRVSVARSGENLSFQVSDSKWGVKLSLADVSIQALQQNLQAGGLASDAPSDSRLPPENAVLAYSREAPAGGFSGLEIDWFQGEPCAISLSSMARGGGAAQAPALSRQDAYCFGLKRLP